MPRDLNAVFGRIFVAWLRVPCGRCTARSLVAKHQPRPQREILRL